MTGKLISLAIVLILILMEDLLIIKITASGEMQIKFLKLTG
jgi:hypothetical protein